MKRFVLGIFIISTFVISPLQTSATTMPCSMVLEPIDKKLTNAKGTALVYKVQLRPQSFVRTNVSILGVHLPEPSSYGNYDSYEGFAFIPDEISWRFRLYPSPEKDSPTWAGKFDEITAKMENVEVQVRLSNLKTEKLGPSILRSNIKYCK
ncbi:MULTISPECIES: hypothetical protein [unclassified Bacillus (in: firmicutes)]|uniref:hypothetical protein n=1 Tax=unclassified Bacillus (in: firmicutes) TaxID=185979 RepID=UPI001BE70173|nr:MULTISPECIES: hypothetical protein [unclassified Bacillus (in: firmicutes)]MBT2614775.1 hypothetical protein [Bacillus sp. ISL-78]MBT2631927.1 hypothetical protein [Bacillus sp. ISL-101]MBT2715755.1 hypothetical protein [Bacillus sp. ISL-57]